MLSRPAPRGWCLAGPPTAPRTGDKCAHAEPRDGSPSLVTCSSESFPSRHDPGGRFSQGPRTSCGKRDRQPGSRLPFPRHSRERSTAATRFSSESAPGDSCARPERGRSITGMPRRVKSKCAPTRDVHLSGSAGRGRSRSDRVRGLSPGPGPGTAPHPSPLPADGARGPEFALAERIGQSATRARPNARMCDRHCPPREPRWPSAVLDLINVCFCVPSVSHLSGSET